MFTPITQLWRRSGKGKVLFLFFCLSLMSLYPIYRNFYNGRAVLSYERHIALLEGRSEYYNPWQYRMLAPMMIEGMMWVYNHTVDKVYPIEEKFVYRHDATSEPTPETKEFLQLLQTKGALKYTIVMVLFRYLLNMAVFGLAFCLWRYFVKSNWLILLGLMFASLAMGNAVIASDLTFNTYLDNVFYLLAACIIVYRKDPRWLIPITVLGALNRETSMMIPFLYFVSRMDFSAFRLRPFRLSAIRFPRPGVWALTAGLYVLFFAVFFSLRQYYGYRPPQVWKVPAGLQMVKLNLMSSVAVKAYFEMLGVFSVIPFLILYRFRAFPLLLRVWFLAIVPAWFAVHIYTVVTYQTRLFLVPTLVVLLPMILWLVEKECQRIGQPAPYARQKSSLQEA